MFARFGGPMTFRFFLQPTMAAIAALVDGIRDAREGHRSFFWAAWRDPTQRPGRLREGMISTARILLLGISMDIIYQFKVLNAFYPAGIGRHCNLARGRPIFYFSVDCRTGCLLVVRPPGRDRRTGGAMENITSGSNSDLISRRAVLSSHGHVVPAHAHERRPHADVGDPHLAVADLLRLHDLSGVREAARPGHHHACRAPAAISASRSCCSAS